MAIVYQHIRKDTNEVFYIGIGKTDRRAFYFGKDKRNKIWLDIFNKTDIQVNILHQDITWEKACELEKYYIKKYGRINNQTGSLANMTDGGEGMLNVIVSEETRKKIGQKSKGRIHSEETRKKLSDITKKQIFTEERNKKISESNKGRIYSEERNKKISDSRIGIIFSQTHRQNISKANIKNGNKPPLHNKLTEDDVIAARKEYSNGNITYKELGIKYKVQTQTITNAIKGITWGWIK